VVANLLINPSDHVLLINQNPLAMGIVTRVFPPADGFDEEEAYEVMTVRGHPPVPQRNICSANELRVVVDFGIAPAGD